MKLVEQHLVKSNNLIYKDLCSLTHLSKNLYNAALYTVRQQYIINKKYLSGYDVINLFTKEKQPDYKSLPCDVAQQTILLVHQNFKSFFGLLKLKSNKQYDGKIRPPKYLSKGGKFTAIFTKNGISKKWLKKGYIKLTGYSFKIKTLQQNINQVRIIPKSNYFIIEVIYEKTEQPLKSDNNRYASIDLGVNNLAVIASNVIKPILISGKPLKSINQYYNKRTSTLKSKLKGAYTSKKIQAITLKRNNKIKDYLHKSSSKIINHLVSNNINTLIVGKNINWKQEVSLGKVNNQNFVSIPYNTFIQMLKYKCKLAGINFVLMEESYTSKCSFLDNETVQKQSAYLGKRIKRGLFESAKGYLINADLNGALNMIRKYLLNATGESFCDYPVEVCSTPKRISFFLNNNH